MKKLRTDPVQPDGLYFLFQQISLCAAPEKQIKYNSLEIIEERSCDSLVEYGRIGYIEVRGTDSIFK